MSNKLTANPFCETFGHNYFIQKNPTIRKPEVFCKSCKRQFRFSLSGNIIDTTNSRYNLFHNGPFVEL